MGRAPLVEFPELVQHYTPHFQGVFSSPAWVQFQRYLSGLIASENKTVDGINRLLVLESRNQSSWNHWLTKSPFSVDALNQARLGLLQSLPGTQIKASGVLIKAIGAAFTQGPQAGDFVYETLARLPQGRATKRRVPLAEQAQRHGLTAEEVGCIDAPRFLAFLWKLAGRPENAPADRQRVRPLVVVLGHYSVHQGQPVQAERAALAAAQVTLFSWPANMPERSGIEPVWTDET